MATTSSTSLSDQLRGEAQKRSRKRRRRKPPLGSGKRFAELEAKLRGKKGVRDPAGLAAYIGRKQLGKKAFQSLAAKGRRRAAR